MKKTFYLSIIVAIATACTGNKTCETKYSKFLYNHVPMPIDTTQSLQYKWDHKEILASKQIDGMESLENWELAFGNKLIDGIMDPLEKREMPFGNKEENIATICLSNEKVFEGESSIKFTSPTKLEVPVTIWDRHWGRENLTCKFNNQDFSDYNRISVQIYPEFKGFRKISLMIALHNDANVPDKYGKSGRQTVMLNNNQWNKVVMEIPDLPHDQVTGITISYTLQGNEPDASDTIVFYADNLMLEKVKPDHFEGWGTNDAISFTHPGYNSNSKKTAFTSLNNGGKFKIIDLATNEPVLEKDILEQTSYIGAFSVFDFSEVKTPGEYKIVYGNIASKPFPINKDVWLPSFEKTINLFYVFRCGYYQPEVHLKCHTDWYTIFKGDTIEMSGGWHDAGDLSQSFIRTAETSAILFKLARKYQSINKKLSDRLVEEGMWGLKWVHKNRFDGLQVIGWTVHGHYSDGITGNFDDTPVQPVSSYGGLDKYFSIIANAEASMALEKIDPELSNKTRHYAIEDWKLLADKSGSWNTERFAMAIMAGSKLFELTGYNKIKHQIIDYADSLLTFQQTDTMSWSTPLNGFFYMDKEKDRVFGYSTRFVVPSPIIGLVELCKLFTEHEKYTLWYNSVRLHANYLKTIAQFTAPYYMIPANVYKLGTTDDAQVLNGVKMDDIHYLRMFPVWTHHRGNNAIVLSFGIGLAAANQLLKDPELQNIAQSQLEWVVGKNPFSQSLMYGEGYDFSPHFAAFTGDVVGGIPVGIQTRLDLDVPYWPPAVYHNPKEIWIHPSYRWLELLDYLDYI